MLSMAEMLIELSVELKYDNIEPNLFHRNLPNHMVSGECVLYAWTEPSSWQSFLFGREQNRVIFFDYSVTDY